MAFYLCASACTYPHLLCVVIVYPAAPIAYCDALTDIAL